MTRANDKIILALDLPNRDACMKLLDRLGDHLRLVKVGPILFGTEGPPLLRDLARRGLGIFLDLKLHDIPHTVGSAVAGLTSIVPLRFLTIHASGGRRMLQAAQKTVDFLPADRRPVLLAVTILTSLTEEDLEIVGFRSTAVGDHVKRLAFLAHQERIGGMVCSPNEISLLRETLPPETLLVVPGIRWGAPREQEDQRRTATPLEAIRAGASFLVIGRPIAEASDPLDIFQQICTEISV